MEKSKVGGCGCCRSACGVSKVSSSLGSRIRKVAALMENASIIRFIPEKGAMRKLENTHVEVRRSLAQSSSFDMTLLVRGMCHWRGAQLMHRQVLESRRYVKKRKRKNQVEDANDRD